MVTVIEIFGPTAGKYITKYWPFAFLALSVYILLFRIGIWSLVYNGIKQITCIALMACACFLWWVILLKHLTHIQEKIGFSAVFDAMNGDLSKFVSNTKIMDPISEILLISGATIFVCGLLYRQLPLTLIPDCIPCIGKYDQFFAGAMAFFGLLIVVVSVGLQLKFAQTPNSTTSLLEVGEQYYTQVNQFMSSDDTHKWDIIVSDLESFVFRVKEMMIEAIKYAFSAIDTYSKEQKQAL